MHNNHNTVMTKEKWDEVRGPLLTRKEVMERLKEHPGVYQEYLELTEEFQEEFIAFSMGVQGAKMTYDSFFKHMFDPEMRPENLEGFLSACFGEPVTIVEVLPNESKRLTEEASLMIADLLVRLQSGVVVNVEIQRIGYHFPGERCACYSSELVMRQYAQIRARRRREKKRFSYGDIKKVYTIVLMHKSTREFHKYPETYLHYSKQTFDSGLNMDLLQEYILVPLDIFLDLPHNEISRLDAWLYFIASDNMSDIERVCNLYPEFCELYRDVFRFRFQPKELMDMYWRQLRESDREVEQTMFEEMLREMEEMKGEREELKNEREELKNELGELAKKRDEAEMKRDEAEMKRDEAEMKRDEAAKECDELNRKLRTQEAEHRLEIERLLARIREMELERENIK